ncbi:MAG: SDR family oxidoreductase [Caldilineaceae bacterium]|nr:SDR family oxidoreductase [Caldilineaceae bacterium]
MAAESDTEDIRSQQPRSVMITGASSGIGRACALWLDRAGWQVFATVRKEADGLRLKSDASPRLRTIQLDVTDSDQISAAARTLSEQVGREGLHGLVNNAGIAAGGLVEYLDPEELRRVFETNTIAPLSVSRHLIHLLRRARGRIVMISSIAGFSSTPLLSPYCASKFALEALTDGMRLELKPWGIDVVSIQPGAIKTDIWDKARSYVEGELRKYPQNAFEKYGPLLTRLAESLEKPKGVDADEVARTVETALTVARPKARYLVGRDALIRSWIESLPTSLRDRLILSRMPKYGTNATNPADKLQEEGQKDANQ